jgi:hypothetical protein
MIQCVVAHTNPLKIKFRQDLYSIPTQIGRLGWSHRLRLGIFALHARPVVQNVHHRTGHMWTWCQCDRQFDQLFISASAALFQNRLTDELRQCVAGINTTALEHAGLSDIRNLVGKDKLREVLTGYNYAVVQTLYVPLALALLTLLGSLPMEWPSVKKKRH